MLVSTSSWLHGMPVLCCPEQLNSPEPPLSDTCGILDRWLAQDSISIHGGQLLVCTPEEVVEGIRQEIARLRFMSSTLRKLIRLPRLDASLYTSLLTSFSLLDFTVPFRELWFTAMIFTAVVPLQIESRDLLKLLQYVCFYLKLFL